MTEKFYERIVNRFLNLHANLGTCKSIRKLEVQKYYNDKVLLFCKGRRSSVLQISFPQQKAVISFMYCFNWLLSDRVLDQPALLSPLTSLHTGQCLINKSVVSLLVLKVFIVHCPTLLTITQLIFPCNKNIPPKSSPIQK